MSARDKQIGGDHYLKLAIQPIDYIQANRMGYIEGSIISYVTRWRDKGGVEDLLKARHMLDMLIEQVSPPRQRRQRRPRHDARQLDIESYINDKDRHENERDNRSAL